MQMAPLFLPGLNNETGDCLAVSEIGPEGDVFPSWVNELEAQTIKFHIP